MKRFLLTLASAAALLVCACEKYDDTSLRNEISGLEKRVENLEDLCSKLNTNIASIQTLLENINSKIAIERVVSLDSGEGYLITFSDGASITVYNGIDGDKGDKGDKGDQGDPGVAPVIGVAQEDGVLYWTLNGEWLLDDAGQKIPVVGPKGDKGDQGDPGKPGSDGNDGQDGKQGEKGVTPQLKIEDGKWMVSYDNGSSWKEVATSGDNPYNTMALTIEETEDAYVITLDGESYTISKAAAAASFQIKVENDDVVLSGGSVTLSYTLTGADETTHVVAEGSLDAVVDEDASTVTINAGNSTEGYVILRAIRNSDGAYSAQYISVAGSVLEIVEGKEFEVSAQGGDIEVKVKTNLDYTFEDIPDWITLSPETKAVRTEIRTLTVAANPSESERTATLKVKSSDGAIECAVVVNQKKLEIETLTVAEFNAKEESDIFWYKLTGKISGSINTTYGNFDLVDETGTVYVYGLTATKQEKNDKSYASLGLKAGDIVTLIGQRGSFNDKIEVVNAYYVSHEPGEEEPVDPEPGEGEQDGSTVSIDFSAQGYANAQEVSSIKVGDITITLDKGTNSNTPKYYNTGAAVRLYGSNTFTVTSSGKAIEKIELTFGSGDTGETNNPFTCDSGSYSSPTWTGSASSVTFTVGGTKGHRRVAKIVVTLAE